MTKTCSKCGKKLNDEATFCTDCGTKLIDKNEIKKAEKKLKELTGGFLPNDIYQEILNENNIPLNEGRKIKNKVKKEIKSGKLNSLNVENRIIDLLVEYTNKKENEAKELKDLKKVNKKLKIETQELKKQKEKLENIIIGLKQTNKEQKERQLKNEKKLKDIQEANKKLKTELEEQNKKLKK